MKLETKFKTFTYQGFAWLHEGPIFDYFDEAQDYLLAECQEYSASDTEAERISNEEIFMSESSIEEITVETPTYKVTIYETRVSFYGEESNDYTEETEIDAIFTDVDASEALEILKNHGTTQTNSGKRATLTDITALDAQGAVFQGYDENMDKKTGESITFSAFIQLQK